MGERQREAGRAVRFVGVLLLMMPCMIRSAVEFTTAVIEKMPQMVQ